MKYSILPLVINFIENCGILRIKTQTLKANPMQALIDIERLEATEERMDAVAKSLRCALRSPPMRNIRTTSPALRLAFPVFDSEHVEKALRSLSLGLGVPMKSAGGEAFVFKAQEDLTDRHAAGLSKLVQGVYDFVVRCFGLPRVEVLRKASMTWRGKVLYSPETGEPITEAEWKRFTADLERFLNRNAEVTGRRIVLDATTLAKLLDRMIQARGIEDTRKRRLDGLKQGNRGFDWISENTHNMARAFGGLSRSELGRLEMLSQSAAEKLTHATDSMKSNVRQVLVDGLLSKKSKGEVSQDLFDKLVGSNRDFQRIADTETQRAFNEGFIREQVANAEAGQPVYFRRMEVVDGNTCAYCRKIDGLIVRWSDTPLDGGGIRDEHADVALWEGKEWSGGRLTRKEDVPSSVCHPFCRGVWVRCNPEKEEALDGKIRD